MRHYYETRAQMFEQKSKDALQHIFELISQNQRLLKDQKRLRTKLDTFMGEHQQLQQRSIVPMSSTMICDSFVNHDSDDEN